IPLIHTPSFPTRRSSDLFSTKMVNGKTVVVGRFARRLKVVETSIIEFGEPDAVYLNDGKGHFSALSWTDGTFVDSDGKALDSARSEEHTSELQSRVDLVC